MTAAQLLASCSDRGVRLWREGDGLGVEWPETLPTATAARLLETLKRAKPALLPLLESPIEAPGEKTDRPTTDRPTEAPAIEAPAAYPEEAAAVDELSALLLAAVAEVEAGTLPAGKFRLCKGSTVTDPARWLSAALERRRRLLERLGSTWPQTIDGEILVSEFEAFADWYEAMCQHYA